MKVQKSGPKKITVLYPLPNTSQPGTTKNEKKQRVAAYCRVSSNSEEQLSSYNAQIQYYEKYIKENPDYIFVGIYADEGITGTNLKKRDAFKRLLQDCREGHIDMIITKSVSRFGRNTLDSLKSIRELRTLGVDVYFEKENIHSMNSEGELLLTLISAVAENESYNLSQNIKWGKRRKYEKGDTHTIPWKNITGYDTDENGEPIIDEEQAVVIRRIYKEFLDGYGIAGIAKHLNDDQVPLVNGGKEWTKHHTQLIITNEKFSGNILFQKTYILDPLTKRKSKNRGELPQYFCENSHPPIITRDIWECVRLEVERQDRYCTEHFNQINRYHNNKEGFPLTSKIVCRHCGHLLKIRVSKKLTDRGTKYYCCPKYQSGYRKEVNPGSCCNAKRILPDVIANVYVQAWNKLVEQRETFLPKWENIIEVGNELERYRAKELINLTAEVGCIDTFIYELMLKTLDHIEIGNDGLAELIFLAGTRVEIRY